MDRRELMKTGLALSLAAAGTAMAQADKSKGAEHHEHHDHGGGKYAALMNASSDCGHIGQVCIAHCFVVLGQGEKEMAACAASVSELLAACDALMKLAAHNSKYVPKMAALVQTVCMDCEKECRKHEKKHQQCKDCADACAACAKECKKVTA
jgi:Cys-rich four helix bundle protein (predicted Tat secretion target)